MARALPRAHIGTVPPPTAEEQARHEAEVREAHQVIATLTERLRELRAHYGPTAMVLAARPASETEYSDPRRADQVASARQALRDLEAAVDPVAWSVALSDFQSEGLP